MKYKYIPLLLCIFLLCTACGQEHSLLRNPEEPEEFAESVVQEIPTEAPTSAMPETSEESTTEPTTEPIENDITEHLVTADELPENLVIPDNAAYCRTEYCEEMAAFGLDSTTYWFYDAHGNEIGSIGYYNGKLEENSRTVTEYEYNEDGTIAMQTVSNYFGETACRYTYNEDGTISECFTFENGEEKGCNLYEYNSYGDVKRDYYINGTATLETRYQNQYDDEGRLVKQIIGDGVLGTETAYFYDAQGRVIREIVRSPYLDEMLYDTVYGYDEAGRRLELTSDHSDSEASVHLWYGYVYFD